MDAGFESVAGRSASSTHSAFFCYPSSSKVTCGATTEDAIEQTIAAGGSSLYDPSTDQYTYVWKTSKAWAGTCRTLVVRLADGTAYKASFRFK